MLQRRANPFEGQKNVFGEPLKGCSDRPATGFYRTGCGGVSYSGQFAHNVHDNAVKGRLTWLF